MADPQGGMAMGGAFLPPYPPQLHHQSVAPRPAFSPFPQAAGMPGFASGAPQLQQQHYNPGPLAPAPPPWPAYAANVLSFHPGHGPYGFPPPGPSALVSPAPSFASVHGGVAGVGQNSIGGGGAGSGQARNMLPHSGLKSATSSGVVRYDAVSEASSSKSSSEGVQVIEQAIEQSHVDKIVDVKELVGRIRSLVAQAEQAVKQIGNLVRLDPCAKVPHLVECPFDQAHRMPAEALFQHHLGCPSNPRPQLEARNLISSLSHRRAKNDVVRSNRLEDIDSHACRASKPLPCDTVNLGPHAVNSEKAQCTDNPKISGSGRESECATHTAPEEDGVKRSGGDWRACARDLSEASVLNEFDIWGGRFLYKDAPAVVRAPLATLYPAVFTDTDEQIGAEAALLDANVDITSAGETVSLKERAGTTDSGPQEREVSNCAETHETSPSFLPSRLWFLTTEVETWKELPTRCSSLVLQAALGLGRIRKQAITDWLLVNSSAHGIVLDSELAGHIFSLARTSLRDVRRQANLLIDSQCADARHSPGEARMGRKDNDRLQLKCVSMSANLHEEGPPGAKTEQGRVMESIDRRGFFAKVNCLDCGRLFRSAKWLASKLCSLYGPTQSKSIVLKLLKHSLVSSGRLFASQFMCARSEYPVQSDSQKPGEKTPGNGDREVKGDEKGARNENCGLDTCDEHVDLMDRNEEVGDEKPLFIEVKTAVSAVHERAVLENYLRTRIQPRSSKYRLIQEYEAAVSLAANERSKRSNYRAVLDYDGLIWHRSQLEDKNKNKSREEILAEERDYKRRRMSYRGKKLKRTPTQVVHDIIEGHMEEIVGAGGIGCFVKHHGEVPSSAETQKMKISVQTIVSGISDIVPSQLVDGSPCPVNSITSPSIDLVDEKRGYREQSQGEPNENNSYHRFSGRSRSRGIEEDTKYSDQEASRGSRTKVHGTYDDIRRSYRMVGDGSEGRSHRRDHHQNSDRYELKRDEKDGRSPHGNYLNERSRDYRSHRDDRYHSTIDHYQDIHTDDRFGGETHNDQSQKHGRRLDTMKEADGSDSFQGGNEWRGHSKSRY